MKLEQWHNDCTAEQREALAELAERFDIYITDAVSVAFAPTILSPYIGIEVDGVFYGIEKDGHTHT